MNRRVWLYVGVVAGCLSTVARGQVPPGATAPPGTASVNLLPARNAADATQFQPVIHQFVVSQFAALQADTVDLQQSGRNKLVIECPKGATTSFYMVYGREVNTAATGLLAAGKPLRVRLGVAIVVNNVAANGQTTEIEPAVQQLLKDREPSVALWGVKAAKPLIGVVLQNPAQLARDTLIADVLAAVKTHVGPDEINGFIAVDGYRAFTPEFPGVAPAAVKSLLPPLFNPMLDLFESRIGQFAGGLVPQPNAERTASRFLYDNYSSMTPAQQHRVVQDLVNLISALGQRSPAYLADQTHGANPLIKKELMGSIHETLKNAAQGLVVITANPAVQGSLEWLEKIQAGATPDEIVQHVKGVPAAVKSIDSALVMPPQLPEIPSTTTEPAPAAPPAPTSPPAGA